MPNGKCHWRTFSVSILIVLNLPSEVAQALDLDELQPPNYLIQERQAYNFRLETPPVPGNSELKGEPTFLSLAKYKPIYFLLGSPYTKIQLSFETQVVHGIPIYFAYSQLMLWDLFLVSPYFYDVDYNPLVLYRLGINNQPSQWIDLIPLEHESNGKGGSKEVSWDRAGLLYHRIDNIFGKVVLCQNYKIWAPLDYNLGTQNLAQYRGIWELTQTFSGLFGGNFVFNDVMLRLYPGGTSYVDPSLGGQELTIRLRGTNQSFLPLALLQIFHGYGEYLQDYATSQWSFRIGIGL